MDSIKPRHRPRALELSTPPHRIAKLSGIAVLRNAAYFASGAHGFNSAHGRMPPIATGANAANRELTYIGFATVTLVHRLATSAMPMRRQSADATSSRTTVCMA